MIQRRIIHIVFLALIASMSVLCGCSPHSTIIMENEDIELPRRLTYRMSYDIVDPNGKVITQEIFENDTENWFIFTEFCKEFQKQLSERGYRFIYDPGRRSDFVVQVGFSAFYSEKISREKMIEQPFATLMVGRQLDDNQFEHIVAMEVLARNPSLSSDEFVVFWKGKTITSSERQDVRYSGLEMIKELVDEFPDPIWR